MKKILSALFITTTILLSTVNLHPARADSTETNSQEEVFQNFVDSTQIVDSLKNVAENSSMFDIPFITKSLPDNTGGTIGTILFIYLGIAIWFWIAWMRKKQSSPGLTWNGSVWWKDNREQIFLYLIFTIILYWNVGVMNPVSAIMLGAFPNAILDLILKFMGRTTPNS